MLGCVLLIDCLHELADNKGNTLNPLDFFLCSYQLSLQAPTSRSENKFGESDAIGLPLLILNVLFL